MSDFSEALHWDSDDGDLCFDDLAYWGMTRSQIEVEEAYRRAYEDGDLYEESDDEWEHRPPVETVSYPDREEEDFADYAEQERILNELEDLQLRMMEEAFERRRRQAELARINRCKDTLPDSGKPGNSTSSIRSDPVYEVGDS